MTYLPVGRPKGANMPRSGRVKKRILLPDPIYGNRLVTRLVNRVMKQGKKTVAQRLVYKAFARIKEKGKDPVEVFKEAVKNVQPMMQVKPRRVGGASYQVPMPVKGDKRIALAIRWLILEARKRPNKEYHTFDQKLEAELLDAAQGQGGAVKKREIAYKMAEANRAFSHFRW